MSRAGGLIRILLTLKILVLIDVQWKKKEMSRCMRNIKRWGQDARAGL